MLDQQEILLSITNPRGCALTVDADCKKFLRHAVDDCDAGDARMGGVFNVTRTGGCGLYRADPGTVNDY
jgi:hypothetical protein